MQTATNNTPDIKIDKSKMMEEPAPMEDLKKEELEEENFKEKVYSEDENLIKKENLEDRRNNQEEGRISSAKAKQLEEKTKYRVTEAAAKNSYTTATNNKKDEDAKNKAAKTDDSGEIETHKEEKTPRDRLHESEGQVINHKNGQFDHQSGQLKSTKGNQPAGKNAKMQTATKNTLNIKIDKSQMMEEPEPMGDFKKEELEEENFKEKGHSEDENLIKKENLEDHRKNQEEGRIFSAEAKQSEEKN